MSIEIECLPYDCEYGPHCYKLTIAGYSEVFYSPHGVAERSGYTTTYIQYLCKNGQINCFMFDGLWFIPVRQAEELKKRKAAKNGNI